ncbi:MAG: hypothetical protein COX37_00350 [Candidatus Nealsonbacteria bacterium CG23_combo_of_CG06-09_8_20_14_all_39_17]|uniref:Uncharacterized protein n=1 Tax=Candidatus Nealsonbacteria bacterium CG23_combo_of_CG06-09_8_20_14_all_39_17 TaxID=1974722 RepID=A0A2G9YV50_9BACT|nr:MAG: hypothetical protein COX37_00350 [Candidatus Nealsonbacteria bacterium CG23_combo_of_CG06-09_8_20_14_all_39_17]PIU43993.1 MAG: hypothetical protein COS96_01460 [Candidatus Nealsonbacteria bacterium CG07_land_8_20_14_0_80_39_13]
MVKLFDSADALRKALEKHKIICVGDIKIKKRMEDICVITRKKIKQKRANFSMMISSGRCGNSLGK